MVSYGPDIQSLNFTHMSSFVDYRCAEKGKNGRKPELCVKENTIYDYIRNSPDFTLFKKIVERAGMMGQLNESQADFTILIPTDSYLRNIPKEYFEKMDDGLARQILASSSINRKI